MRAWHTNKMANKGAYTCCLGRMIISITAGDVDALFRMHDVLFSFVFHCMTHLAGFDTEQKLWDMKMQNYWEADDEI